MKKKKRKIARNRHLGNSSVYATPAHIARVVDFPAAREAAERGECDRAISAFGSGAVNFGKSRGGPVEGETVAEWKKELAMSEASYQHTLQTINQACRCRR